MKTLANCKPSEFLRQTNRARKCAERWMEATDIASIRKRLPELNDDMTDEEKQAALEKQVKANMSAILDEALEKHPDETLELLALVCFVEPEDVDDYPMVEYIDAANALINNKTVTSFFISLLK